ncbi:MAG: hypothetical protein GY899_14985 [Verrucomicrobiaceae bacterium]|nr:hypothetical protein [Verrucomicrobiaceae bacterium]
MAANDDSEGGEPSLAGLQSELEVLTLRVAALEATLQHEHDDLLRLKKETKADHQRLEGLTDNGGGTGTPSSPVTPVGL